MSRENGQKELAGLLRLARNKGGKHYYRLVFVEQGKERVVEEKEIDGDRDEETRIIFEDYSNRKDNNGIN